MLGTDAPADGGGPRRPVAYTPRHGPPFSSPTCPGQGRGDRIRPGPVLQRRHLRHRDHPADRGPAGPGCAKSPVGHAAPGVHSQDGGFALSAPAVFLLLIPFAIRQPALGQDLWLLALVSAMVIRRLEPPETDPTTTENGDPSKPQQT